MTTLCPPLKFKAFNVGSTTPLVGGKLYTYDAGTTTPRATYKDSTLLSLNTNPVILNSNGEADVWLDGGSYKLVLKAADDSTVWPAVDNVVSLEAAIASLSAIAIKTVATFAALSSTTATIGQQVITRGHTVAGIGDALFNCVSSTGLVANNGTIAINGAIAWVLISPERPNILNFGGLGNGSANDLAACQSMASVLGYVEFPLIGSGITTYKIDYSTPNQFDNITFYADKGVILSFSANAPYSLYKNIVFGTDINVIFRDINVPYIFPKSVSVGVKSDYQKPAFIDRRITYPLDATAVRSVYVLECPYLSSDTFTGAASTRFFDSVNITATGAGNLRGCFIDLGPNETASAYFNEGVTTGPIGVVIRGVNGYATIISNGDNNYLVGYKPIGGAATGPTASLSWAPLGQSQYTSFRAENSLWSVTRVDATRCIVKLNGQALTQPYAQNVGDILQVGFVYLGNSAAATISGLYVERVPGRLVSNQRLDGIHIFGDSTAEAFPGSWDKSLKEILDGRYGLKVLTVTNLAVTGETLDQQYARMLSVGFGNSYYVIVCAGTNNVQSVQTLAAWKTVVVNTINLILSNGRVPIFVAPWMWYTQAQTGGIGQPSSQYDKAAPYRMILERACAESGVMCVKPTDLLPNPSPNYIFTDSNTRLLRDNIHQDSIGYQLYAEMICAGIIDSYMATPRVVEQRLPATSFLNSATSVDFRIAINKDGICNICGTFTVSVIADGSSIVELPRFARPSADTNFPILCLNAGLVVTGTGYALVAQNGDFKIYKVPATTTTIILSNVSYKILFS